MILSCHPWTLLRPQMSRQQTAYLPTRILLIKPPHLLFLHSRKTPPLRHRSQARSSIPSHIAKTATVRSHHKFHPTTTPNRPPTPALNPPCRLAAQRFSLAPYESAAVSSCSSSSLSAWWNSDMRSCSCTAGKPPRPEWSRAHVLTNVTGASVAEAIPTAVDSAWTRRKRRRKAREMSGDRGGDRAWFVW